MADNYVTIRDSREIEGVLAVGTPYVDSDLLFFDLSEVVLG